MALYLHEIRQVLNVERGLLTLPDDLKLYRFCGVLVAKILGLCFVLFTVVYPLVNSLFCQGIISLLSSLSVTGESNVPLLCLSLTYLK